ncbi:MAG TPA: FAD-dependent oxidoreductase [Amycolatopsis sp.]|nr:FAD-dependent oxidoreductase [Amycolatopsis sp.]
MSTDSAHRRTAVPLPAVRERVPWTNWSQSQTCTPLYTFAPSTAEEVARVVRFAIAQDIPVRTKGGGYSFSPLVHTGGILLDMVNYSGLGDIDSANHRAWVKAGTGVNELGDLLWAKGLAITVQGAFDLQTFVGAAATGTHGSGSDFGCLSSCARGVHLVDGHGDIVEIGEQHLAEPAAAQVSLGMLGSILEVLLQAEPRYFLSKEVSFPDWPDASATLEQDVAANRHYANMCFPHHGSPGLYRMPVPQARDMAGTCWIEACNRAPAPEVDTGVRSWESDVGRRSLIRPRVGGPRTVRNRCYESRRARHGLLGVFPPVPRGPGPVRRPRALGRDPLPHAGGRRAPLPAARRVPGGARDLRPQGAVPQRRHPAPVRMTSQS